jgi:hypothetical protein
LADGALIAGGGYWGVGGRPERNVVRVDPVTGTLDRSFADASRGSGAWVFAIVPGDNRVFFGGFFDTFGGLPRDSVAAVGQASLSLIPALSPGSLAMLGLVLMIAGAAASRRFDPGRLNDHLAPGTGMRQCESAQSSTLSSTPAEGIVRR